MAQEMTESEYARRVVWTGDEQVSPTDPYVYISAEVSGHKVSIVTPCGAYSQSEMISAGITRLDEARALAQQIASERSSKIVVVP